MNFIFILLLCVVSFIFLLLYGFISKKYFSSKNQLTTPDQALAILLHGNKIFNSPWSRTTRKSRKATAQIQKPFAIILNCSDSRVPTEIIFNQLHVGSLFVVRNAGNVIDGVVLGSIEYGIEQLGALLIIVLGHEHCGAVTLTIDNIIKNEPAQSDHIQTIINAITPAVHKALLNKNITLPLDEKLQKSFISDVIKENVLLEMSNLYRNSEIIKQAVDTNKIKIVGAYYDLEEGNIQIIG